MECRAYLPRVQEFGSLGDLGIGVCVCKFWLRGVLVGSQRIRGQPWANEEELS